MKRLEGRVAIVTGGGQGIGRGVARSLGAEGASVVIANRKSAAGEAVAKSIEREFGVRALHVRTDISQRESTVAMVGTVVDAFGRVDVLVNNATPASGMSRLETMATETVEEHTKVNYFGALWAMQAAFPSMKANGWGRIITMCSLNGINAHRYTAMYNGAKEAVRALTRTAAVEWARYGITCNVLCPAAVTPPWEVFIKYDPDGAAAIVEAIPAGRMGDAEADIGPVVVFLASEESRYVTGNTIHADGGGHINGVPWRFELPD